MTPTVVEIGAQGDGVSCRMSGDLVVPRLVRRQGRSVEVALVAGRALLLPGDDVRLRISVGSGCALALVDIGGLIVYGRPGEAGDASHWHAEIDLAPHAHLTWNSLPTVITDAGHLVRSLRLNLDSSSSAVLRETLVLGRAGERGGRIEAETEASDSRGPILRETLRARGDVAVPGILGPARVMDSIVAVGDCTPLPSVGGATLLELERAGTVLRYLGDDAHASPLDQVILDTVSDRMEPAYAS